MKKVLILAAHPDDDVLGCGGILSKFQKKTNFKVVFLGEGSTCRYNMPKSPDAIKEIKIRNGYAVNALNSLGVSDYSFYDLPCGRFNTIPLIEINKLIEKEIKSFKPDTVFTHSKRDSNKDHVIIYESTIIATRPGSGVKKVLSYEVLSSSEWNYNNSFSPNVFISLSEKNIHDKCNALSMYLSETGPFPYPRSNEGVINLANRRGIQCGSPYAEAFSLVRQFEI